MKDKTTMMAHPHLGHHLRRTNCFHSLQIHHVSFPPEESIYYYKQTSDCADCHTVPDPGPARLSVWDEQSMDTFYCLSSLYTWLENKKTNPTTLT